MKMLAVCCLLLSALCLRAELAFKWTVEVSQPLPYAAEALQGESFNLEAKVVQYRVPMLEAAEATFYYQTPEMEASQWYTVPAAWDDTTATASVAFTPAMDVGNTKYRFFFGIETAQGKNYRVFGTLRLKTSPGFSPATLTPTDVRAEMIQEILEAVFEESDERYATKAEHAALAVQVQGKADASHTHSDLQQSATVLLQAINSEAETREAADAALEAALAEEVATREEADVKLSAQVPVVRATLPNATNNANGYGYRGPLSRLGVYGEAVVIRRLAITTRPSGSQNTTTPLWARVVRNVDGAWVVCAQSKEPRKWEEVAPGSDLAWEMEAVPGVLPPSADESVAIVWVNDPDAPAARSDGQVSWRTVSVSGGLGFALPTVPTTSSSIQSWSPRIVLDFTAVTKALKVDTSLSSTSTNPVQNSALYYEINGKASKTEFNSDNYATPYVKAFGTSMHSLRTVFNANNEADNWAEKFDNAKLTFEWWHQYNNVKEDSFDVPMTAFRALANGGGGHTEVWKGNVGFGEQDTFFGPKAVAAEEGQFYKGYPRLHNHGQDIHEVSGFSRDSRDDETVWSHRLLLPWDLAKANDTSYLMAGVVWNGKRRILTHPNYGLETTFVQPLIPENTGETKAYGITHAIPCFENSPMYWNGNIIYNDSEMLDSGVPAEATKAVIIPWSRVTGVVGNPSELALKSDLETLKSDPVERSAHAIAWQKGTSLLTVTPNADGAVVFDPTGWPEGQSLLVRLTTPEDFEGMPASVRLVGYFDIEPASTYQLTAYVVGGTLHVVPLLREE